MGKWRKPTKFTVIQPVWKGIFVTCVRGRETQCAREVREWFEAVAEEHWPDDAQGQNEDEKSDLEGDIEAEIQREVDGLSSNKRKKIVVHEKLGVECVVFVQTRYPVDPVKLSLIVCEQTYNREHAAKYIQRLAPVQQFVKCEAELNEIGGLKPVLEKHMRDNTRFAIRPTLRLTQVNRDVVIPAIAKLVGPNHKVDLQNYEQLVLVEGFKGVLGIAVVDLPASEVTKYCRLNLSQIVATNSKETEEAQKKPKEDNKTESKTESKAESKAEPKPE